ncbi:MAG TPA: hypothetical protein PLZ43_14910 [bacterium]|nr:hypothetical protein [bacterium]
MAKLSMPINTQNDPEVDVIAEDIASALAQLSWLLEGRIDYDNIAKIIDGSEERPLQIPASKVQDIPLISNEINCNKFFNDDSDGNSFQDMVWTPLKEKIMNNPVLTSIQGTESIVITQDSLIFQDRGQGNFPYGIGSTKKKDFEIEIEIPKNYVPITYRRLFEIFEITQTFFDDIYDLEYGIDDYVVEYEWFVDADTAKSSLQSARINTPSYSPTSNRMKLDITINIGVGDNMKMEEGEYVNANLTMSVLCEERI